MKTLIALSMILAMTSVANAAESKASDAQAVNTACSTDAATAGCGTEKVGTGLLKCLAAYKKAHKDFKFSDTCVAARKTLRSDRKAK